MMMQCEHCGKEFEVRKANQRFCCERCRRTSESRRRNANGPHGFTCRHCGQEYQTAYKDRNTYCSRECAFKDKERRCACGVSLRGIYGKNHCDACAPSIKPRVQCVCAVCGKVFETTKEGRKYCSKDCVKENNRMLALKYDKESFEAKVTPSICKECSCVFIPEYGTKRRVYCSAACYKKAMGRLNPSNHQRRAKRYGVKYEWFSDLVILRRDGWRCYICGCSTPQELRGTYEDNAPEIDHVVPLSKGGTHTKDNVRCCCRACNGAKADMTLKKMRQARVNQAHQKVLL